MKKAAKAVKATTHARNTLFDILSRVTKRGQSITLYTGHRLERAAHEFEAEGLVQINDGGARPGEFFQVTRTF